MIIFDGIKIENKNIAILNFSNNTGDKISIPVSLDVANLIAAHLQLIAEKPSSEG